MLRQRTPRVRPADSSYPGYPLTAVSSFQQACSSQAIGEHREILRSADGEPIRQMGDGTCGIKLAQMADRSLRFLHAVRKRMARCRDADDGQEARHMLERLLRP